MTMAPLVADDTVWSGNLYRPHDRSKRSIIPAKSQDGEIPNEALTTFADIIAMHSELAGHAAVGAAAYTRTMPVTNASGRLCWPVPYCEDRLRGMDAHQAGFLGLLV